MIRSLRTMRTDAKHGMVWAIVLPCSEPVQEHEIRAVLEKFQQDVGVLPSYLLLTKKQVRELPPDQRDYRLGGICHHGEFIEIQFDGGRDGQIGAYRFVEGARA